MDNEQYSILYNLNSIVNQSDDVDVDSILAKYFLCHYQKAQEFNIYDIAASCHVSRASIRRFAIKMGYTNFLSLKKSMIAHKSEPRRIDDNYYRRMLTNNIISIVTELNKRMDTTEVDVMVQRYQCAKSLYILASGPSVSVAHDFQVSLSAKGCLCYVISDPIVNMDNIIKKVSQKDVLLTLSISGSFALRTMKFVQKLSATKDLVTVNRIDNFESTYDHIYYMSHLDHSSEANEYRSYGLHYLLDILKNHY